MLSCIAIDSNLVHPLNLLTPALSGGGKRKRTPELKEPVKPKIAPKPLSISTLRTKLQMTFHKSTTESDDDKARSDLLSGMLILIAPAPLFVNVEGKGNPPILLRALVSGTQSQEYVRCAGSGEETKDALGGGAVTDTDQACAGTSTSAEAGAKAAPPLATTSFVDAYKQQMADESTAAPSSKQGKPIKALQAAEQVRARQQKKEAEREEKRRQMRLALEAKKAVATKVASTCPTV